MPWKTIAAVIAGVLFVIAFTTLVDIALHQSGYYGPASQALSHEQALVATAYRIVISVMGGWLTARLAPNRPLHHAMLLGYLGTVLGFIGVVATWNLGMGPRWYPIALMLLAIPQSWLGGRIYQAMHPERG